MVVQNFSVDGSSSMPSLEVPESEKTPQWYADVLRYYTSFYNKPYSTWGNDRDDTIYSNSPVEQMRLWFYYYLGRQPNLNFNHFFDQGTGTSVQNTWINGQKIPQLIKRMEGNASDLLNDIEVSTKALSKEARNKRAQMIEDAMLEFDNATFFKNLEEQFGIKPVSEIPEQNRQSKEDAMKYAEYDWKEYGEFIAQTIAENIFVKNDGKEIYRSAFRHAVVGGLCGIHTYADNGFVKFDYVPSWNCIWDNRKEDDFNKKARFAGFIEYLTITDIINKYKDGKVKNGLKEDEIEELKGLAKNNGNDWLSQYQTAENFKWYSMPDGSTVGEIGVVHMYWICLRDTRYKKETGLYGGDSIMKLNDNKKKNQKVSGDYHVMDVYKATLIGNKYLVDFGPCNNIVRDPFNQSDPIMPLRFFIPGMTMDQFRSYVSRIAEIQDQMDALRFKMMEMVGRDLGKNYIINGNKLGMVRPKDLLTDFKSMGVHVATGTDGEIDSIAATQKQVELVDLTLDPNVVRYIELLNYFETTMEEIVSIPKVALGQERQVGLGVQQGIMANSSQSNKNLYDGFIHFLEMNLQYATNMQKNIYCIKGNEDAELVVGDRGMRYIKETKGFNFENFGISISLKDILTPEKRQQLWQMAFSLAQNGVIDMKDAIKIQTETSLLKLNNYYDFSIEKKKKEREAEMAQQAQAQQALQEQKNLGMLGATAMKEDAANERNSLDNKTKIMSDAAKFSQGQ